MKHKKQTVPAVKPANETETAAALAVIISALAESLENNREQMRFAADPEIFDTLANERKDLLAALTWAEAFAAGMKGGKQMSVPDMDTTDKASRQLSAWIDAVQRGDDYSANFIAWIVAHLPPHAVKGLAADWDDSQADKPQGKGESK